MNENDYIFFKNDNFKIRSNYKFEFSEKVSKDANELSVFPTNVYTYYYDDKTYNSITEYMIQTMDIKSIYNNSPKLKYNEITEKYFNSVKFNISFIDKNYTQSKKNNIKYMEYSSMAGTGDIQIPTRGIFFVKHKKAYSLSVISNKNINVKMKKLKKAFEFIQE